MHIRFLWVGKTRNPSLRALLADYLERIGHWAACEVVEAREPSRGRVRNATIAIAEEGAEIARHLPDHGRIVALDEKGKQLSSSEFAAWLEAEQNRGARSITFVIGGPEGLSRAVSGRAHLTLSLGSMTWTHEMCRLLLVEQVYRAFCIVRGIPYHKG